MVPIMGTEGWGPGEPRTKQRDPQGDMHVQENEWGSKGLDHREQRWS